MVVKFGKLALCGVLFNTKKQLLFLIVIDNLYICIKSMHY